MNYLKLSLLLITAWYAPCLYGGSFEEGQIFPYAEVFNLDHKQVIIGTLKSGTPILLLSENYAPCPTEATDVGSYHFPINEDDIQYTNLKVIKACHTIKAFGAIVGVNEVRYQYLHLSAAKDDQAVRKILSSVKRIDSKDELEELKLSASLPTLWRIPHQKGKQYVAQLKRKSRSNGPIFFYKDHKVFPLEGECPSEIKVFSVNGRTYIRYIEVGCASGVNIVHVYDISKDKPHSVYKNSTWST